MVVEQLYAWAEPFLPGIEQSYFVLLGVTIGMAVYSLLIYWLYHFVAKRDVFELDVEKYKIETPEGALHRLQNLIVGMLKYGLIFPLFVFVWFAGFSVLLFFLNKTQPTDQVLLIAMAVVSTVRLTSYVHADLAQDLAKTLPLVLLATALVQPDFFSLGLVQERFAELPNLIRQAVQLVSFSILLEWIMRIFLVSKKYLRVNPETGDVA